MNGSKAVQHASDKTRKPNWNRYLKLVKNATPLKISSSYPKYALGESIALEVEMPTDGYLNIVRVDSKDRPTVLFPNANHPDNYLKAGAYHFPDTDAYDWPAEPPYGRTLLVALVSRREMNLFGSGQQRDLSGKPRGKFSNPSPAVTRGMGQASAKSAAGFYGGALVIDICATLEDCE